MGAHGGYHNGYHGFQGEHGQGTPKRTLAPLTKNPPPPPLEGPMPLGDPPPFGGLHVHGGPTPLPKGPLPPLGGHPLP